MSGHSKWATIKRKKGAADAKRGKEFTRIAHMLTIAAREGGGDPAMNVKLRLAMDKARASNMPSANIDRSIKRGTGELGGAPTQEVTYEGYGPGGVAVLVTVLTDNRNRSAADIRSFFTKAGGKLGESNSVAWMFESKGLIRLTPTPDLSSEDLQLVAIEAGATDVDETDDGELLIYTEPREVDVVRRALEEAPATVEDAEVAMEPKDALLIEDKGVAEKVMKFLEQLDDYEDAVSVTSNFDTNLELE
jgi:YebC/PmpR family DNA-binding regulatory protein